MNDDVKLCLMSIGISLGCIGQELEALGCKGENIEKLRQELVELTSNITNIK